MRSVLQVGFALALLCSGCDFSSSEETAETLNDNNWEREKTNEFVEEYNLNFSPALNTFADPANIISRPPDKDAIQERIDTLKNALDAAISVNIIESNQETSSKNIALHVLKQLQVENSNILVIVISKEEETAAVAASESIMKELESYEKTDIRERVAPTIVEGDYVGALLKILNDFERIFNPPLEED